ncbi:hypothetical protein ACSMX9_27245 [Streptomyces sp. LE64]|uniref:hypothetical protein n=1 Tax=Streptomyces sp. LE64 TaxID=3448653 RepID=UPI0040413EEE
MNSVTAVLRALHHGEQHLAEEFLAVVDRHPGEHEVHHVGRDLAAWSREHAHRLAETAGGGTTLAPGPGLFGTPGAAVGAGRPREPGLLLLHDLGALHLSASGNSLRWEMLAQAAQAIRNEELLDLASACHPQTLRQIRWTNTMIKNLSPQILTSA